jgi:hypothetical protein
VFDPLEERRVALLNKRAVLIQKIWRGFHFRTGSHWILLNTGILHTGLA